MVEVAVIKVAASTASAGNPAYTFLILAALIGAIVLLIRFVRRRRSRANEPLVLSPQEFLKPQRVHDVHRAPASVPVRRQTPAPVSPPAPTTPPPRHVTTFPNPVPGAQVAGYKLIEQIGRGGMAVVFRAQDERLRRMVAIKILAPALADDKDFRLRFIRESRAAAALDDPNIIPVFQAGRAGDVLFIAMRFVSGGDLRTLLDREGQLTIARTIAIISPVASALDTAHAATLVHRDVKPANILIDVRPRRPDHVYLSDFGLAKSTATVASLTGTGHFLGTLDYISPEQIEGKPVDGQTDQYALACTAFELLTGAPPFRRSDAAAIMYAQLSEPPPELFKLRPDLPLALGRVLTKALAKSPKERFPTCTDFADAVRSAAGLPAYRPDDTSSALSHPPTQIV